MKGRRADLVKKLPDCTIDPAGDLSDSLKLVSVFHLKTFCHFVCSATTNILPCLFSNNKYFAMPVQRQEYFVQPKKGISQLSWNDPHPTPKKCHILLVAGLLPGDDWAMLICMTCKSSSTLDPVTWSATPSAIKVSDTALDGPSG